LLPHSSAGLLGALPDPSANLSDPLSNSRTMASDGTYYITHNPLHRKPCWCQGLVFEHRHFRFRDILLLLLLLLHLQQLEQKRFLWRLKRYRYSY
uniref:Growth hormone releasing hormone receptor n=1 Tax=Schistocephalus solidus TaxID=70667 RepID=A0A183TU19_SCHSO